jgi:YidC/Oxa1 family membrane protein insertase
MPPAATALASASQAPEKTIEVDTELYHASFTTHGGRLKSLRLKQYRETAASDSPPYEMVRAVGNDELPLSVILNQNEKAFDDRALDYQVNGPDTIEIRDGQPASLTLDAQTSDGAKIEKTFSFVGDKYAFDMAVAVTAPTLPTSIGLTMMEPLAERGEGYYDIPRCRPTSATRSSTKTKRA